MDEIIHEIIRYYIDNGIVTRNDVASLDSRSFGRTLKEKMKSLGYPEAIYEEFEFNNYEDYSGVLYNPTWVERGEVKTYMDKHVLKVIRIVNKKHQ